MNNKTPTALVLGAGGFIGNHMVTRLKAEGYWVRGVDIKRPEFETSKAHEFLLYDLRKPENVEAVMDLCDDFKFHMYRQPFEKSGSFDEVYQFAADMGGAGFVFTGENDADIILNSAQINLNVCRYATTERIFYSSSACAYPEFLQSEIPGLFDGTKFALKEDYAWDGPPDSTYGKEKLFSEELYLSHARNKSLDVRIARFHNIFGPLGTFKGGREKAPAAMCRKAAEATKQIEVWGSGDQARSFLFIDDCIEAVRRLVKSEFKQVVNIGSTDMVTINELARFAIYCSGKDLAIKNIEGPQGVMGRNSDNTLIERVLDWRPQFSLRAGMAITYKWIESQVNEEKTV